MNPDVIQLRPEVLELVREIAARPDSVLLRVPRGAEMRTLREDRAVVSPTSTNLSRAERHLVAVYREEVAYVLRCAAWRAITTSEWGERYVNLGYVHGTSIAVPSARSVSQGAATQLSGTNPAQLDDTTLWALEHLAGLGTPFDATARVLSAIAHRLVPSATCRIYAAMALKMQGRVEAARLMYVDAWRIAPSPEIAAAALQNYGESELALGRIERARDASMQAHLLCPSLTSALVSVLWNSICLGDTPQAEAAKRELEMRDPSTLTEYQKRFLVDRQKLKASLTAEGRYVLDQVRDDASAGVGRLLHAVD